MISDVKDLVIPYANAPMIHVDDDLMILGDVVPWSGWYLSALFRSLTTQFSFSEVRNGSVFFV